MKRQARNPNRRRSTQRLVRIALRRWNSGAAWRAISELHQRGDDLTVALATALASSRNWRRRCLGLEIAAQLRRGRGSHGAPHALPQTQQLLLDGLNDPHHEVIRAAVGGLGHRPHPAALGSLVRLSSDRNELLRWATSVTLGSYPQPAAVEALLRLATDPDDLVRDWATFSLGTQQAADTPEIRALLWLNMQDRDECVRGEALAGLAKRRDERLIDQLLLLLTPDCSVYELDAAETLADGRLLGALQAIAVQIPRNESNGHWFNRLQSAIAACQASPSPPR